MHLIAWRPDRPHSAVLLVPEATQKIALDCDMTFKEILPNRRYAGAASAIVVGRRAAVRSVFHSDSACEGAATLNQGESGGAGSGRLEEKHSVFLETPRLASGIYR